MLSENEFTIVSDDLNALLSRIDKKHVIKGNLTQEEYFDLLKETKRQCEMNGPLSLNKKCFGSFPLESITPLEQMLTKLYYFSKEANLENVMVKIAMILNEKLGQPLQTHFILNDLQAYIYKKREVNPTAIKRTIDLCLLDFELIKTNSLPVSAFQLPCVERLISIYIKEKEISKALSFIDQVLLVIGGNGLTGQKLAQQKIKLMKSLEAQ